MAMAGALLDWENLRSRGVQPSFSLPSSHHGVRWNVASKKIQEVCARHPQKEYRQLCDREAVLFPLMLNHPEQKQLDHQVFRVHLEKSRSGVNKKASDRSQMAEVLTWRASNSGEVQLRKGQCEAQVDTSTAWRNLVKVVELTPKAPPSNANRPKRPRRPQRTRDVPI